MKRRDAIKLLVGPAVLGGCGGGGPQPAPVVASSVSSPTPTASAPGTSSSSPSNPASTPTSPGAGPSNTAPTSATGLSLGLRGQALVPQPFTVGMALAPGLVPSGRTLGAALSAFQCDVRTRWADGSLRFAVLSGLTDRPVALLNTAISASESPPVPEPQVQASVRLLQVTDSTGATVAGGELLADLATARRAGPRPWSRAVAHRVRALPGPAMSEFHYFVPTGDEHLAVWFIVRAYVNGAVEVETIVENGWLKVARPDRRDYQAQVTVGETLRLDSGRTAPLRHWHHARWSRVDWVSGEPTLVVLPDLQHLQTTGLVPQYAVRTLLPEAYTARPSNGPRHAQWTRAMAERPAPMDRANLPATIGGAGENDTYGIIPGWGATLLIEGHEGAYWSCLANARAMGRYSLHYRDEADGRPFRVGAHRDLGYTQSSGTGLSDVDGADTRSTFLPAPGGGFADSGWTDTHGPAAYFMAALLTGRWQFIEGVSFTLGANHLKSDLLIDGLRAAGWWQQGRAQGWNFRNVAQAEAVVPSETHAGALDSADQAQRREAEGRLRINVGLLHETYVSGTGSAPPTAARGNAFGLPWQQADFNFIGGTSTADGEHGYGGLQTGFFITGALYLSAQQASVGSELKRQMQAVARHFARFPIGMFGAAIDGSAWDWRVAFFVTLGFGSPGAVQNGGDPQRTVFRRNWSENWARLKSGAPYVWAPGTFDLPEDRILRKIRFNESASSPALLLDPLPHIGADTDVLAITWAAAYAHQLQDDSQSDLAARRLYTSTTWAQSLETTFRIRPEFAVISPRATEGRR